TCEPSLRINASKATSQIILIARPALKFLLLNFSFLILYPILPRHQTKNFVLRRVSDHSHRILAPLDGFNGLFEQAAHQDHTFIRHAKVFPRAIEDLALALLCTAVLIATRDPAGLLIPSILSRDTVAESLVLLILRNFCRHFSIHDRRKIEREMHG